MVLQPEKVEIKVLASGEGLLAVLSHYGSQTEENSQQEMELEITSPFTICTRPFTGLDPS